MRLFMKDLKSPLFVLVSALAIIGCSDSSQKNVIATRYVHKYGYDVSKEDWETKQHPGQIITTLQDGKTIVESYEDAMLHGPRTETFPHSQTVQILETYERGKLAKRVTFSIRGVPQQEEVFKSPTHILLTTWYPTGTPKSKEEYKESLLINGQYFNSANETDSRIENGTGEKTLRNTFGDLLSKEVYNSFMVTYVETYYPNNTPYTATAFENGKKHGECKVFSMSGDPISVESYVHGEKHGLCTYYQNGSKYLEVPYVHNVKHGTERQFIDGEITVKEIDYQWGQKHGPSVIYCDGSARTTWYFDNHKVSRSKYDELVARHDMIMSMQH